METAFFKDHCKQAEFEHLALSLVSELGFRH